MWYEAAQGFALALATRLERRFWYAMVAFCLSAALPAPLSEPWPVGWRLVSSNVLERVLVGGVARMTIGLELPVWISRNRPLRSGASNHWDAVSSPLHPANFVFRISASVERRTVPVR